MIFTTHSVDNAIEAISDEINSKLASGSPVLWLVSGGSAVQAQVAIMDLLTATDPELLEHLTILPVDERFGPFDHKDSNGAQLGAAGFNPYPASWIDVLSENLDFDATVQQYDLLVSDALKNSEYVLATLGLGADGHTAGILPNSPAVSDTTDAVVGFKWSDYTRMTLSLTSLCKIHTAYVLAYGDSKEAALIRLKANGESPEDLPSKLLHDIPQVTVYNDFIQSE